MCAEFVIRGQIKKALRANGLPLTEIREDAELDERIRLFGSAPVILQRDGQLVLDRMSFSLKSKGTPYPTFNARIESWDEKTNQLIPIFKKPTWRKPFINSRCLVPMTAFVEPIYTGENAGHMVQFAEKSGQLLLAAGIFEENIDKKTGEIYTGFALVMDEPSDFVLENGHHRQPLLLSAKSSETWLSEEPLDPDEGYTFLKRHREYPELKVEVDRQMAKGWEKRIDQSLKKAARELEFSEIKKRLGPPRDRGR